MNKKNSAKVKTKPIYNFFSAKKTTANVVSPNSFYEENLPKVTPVVEKQIELHRDEEIKNLQQQIEKLTLENTKCKKENQKIKNDMAGLLKVHKELCRLYVNKEMMLKMAEKRNKQQGSILFDSFKNDLGENVLCKLRKLHISKRSDSTFILQCMRQLFENEKELNSVSACGINGHKMVSDEKRDILDRIFLERLSSDKLTEVELTERYIRLNRHINVAIGNMRQEVSFSLY